MAEISNGKKVFSLLEVASSIQKTISQRYTTFFWVKAEMNKLNHYPQSGHCYPDLVEKVDGKVIAQMKSTLWKDDYNRINNIFLSVVKSPLKEGIKMLFCARMTFDPMHGLALRITDIDPVFSLGELEREKQESILALQKEGIFARNKSLGFPLLPKRIAVISVETSKGYADFRKVIESNPWGYRFFHVLFPSLLQGDRAVDSIRGQLNRIRAEAQNFDVVAIIRGGGGEVGLSCFNSYRLSKEIALFPLPVITGIGHATNETVAEMVSHRNAITPTELADFLIQKFHDFAQPVRRAEEVIIQSSLRIVAAERERIFHTMKFFRSVTGNVLLRRRHDIQRLGRDLFKQSTLEIVRQKQRQGSVTWRLKDQSSVILNERGRALDEALAMMRRSVAVLMKHQHSTLSHIGKTVSNMHPLNVLKRGYSITRVNGKVLTSVDQVGPSEILQTTLRDGTIISQANKTEKSSEP